jgi:hypothetical protein
MKIKVKPKHWRIAKHYASCINYQLYPDFELTEELVERFIRFESYGEKSLNKEERISINPFVGERYDYRTSEVYDDFGAKGRYELNKKQIHEELFDWWAKDWGWSYPIAANIYGFFKSRHVIGNTTAREYISVYQKIRKLGIVEYLTSLKGSIFSFEEIQQILEKKLCKY